MVARTQQEGVDSSLHRPTFVAIRGKSGTWQRAQGRCPGLMTFLASGNISCGFLVRWPLARKREPMTTTTTDIHAGDAILGDEESSS